MIKKYILNTDYPSTATPLIWSSHSQRRERRSPSCLYVNSLSPNTILPRCLIKHSWQLGNEINSGILFPIGEISVNGYDGLSQLLHSAATGARAGSSTLKTMIHLANGWEESAVTSFYEQIFRAGEFATTDIDIMGFSFYPFYGTGATLSALEASLQSIYSSYGKVFHFFV